MGICMRCMTKGLKGPLRGREGERERDMLMSFVASSFFLGVEVGWGEMVTKEDPITRAKVCCITRAEVIELVS